jgi:hypothetical protein
MTGLSEHILAKLFVGFHNTNEGKTAVVEKNHPFFVILSNCEFLMNPALTTASCLIVLSSTTSWNFGPHLDIT